MAAAPMRPPITAVDANMTPLPAGVDEGSPAFGDGGAAVANRWRTVIPAAVPALLYVYRGSCPKTRNDGGIESGS